jgi:hypothetical protein
MERDKAQLFLSIMDTLHDFTGARIKSIEGGKMIHQMVEDMILRLLRPEIDQVKAHLRDQPAMEEMYGFLDMLHKERDYYGVGNLIPPENVEASTKHMMYKYVLRDKVYKPIYNAKRDLGTNEANNVWKNRENMYRDYHRYMTDAIQINVGDKSENTGIFAIDGVSSQATNLYDYLKLVYNANKIMYVPDANALGKDMLCINDMGHPTVYKGIFDQYDFSNTSTSGGAPKKKPSQVSAASSSSSCLQREFQEYALSSNEKELLALPIMQVGFDAGNNEYILKHKLMIDLDFEKKQRAGILLFVKCLLKLRTYLGSLRYLTPDEKRELEAELQSESLKLIYGMYRITLTKDDMKDKDKVRNYLLSLFDLKRSGDYLAVKACAEANKNAPEGTKFVFVSNDQLAILYAHMQNIPCILTTLMGRKKDKLFLTIYNIHRQVRDPQDVASHKSTANSPSMTRSVTSRMHLMSPNPRTKPSTTTKPTTEQSAAQRVAHDLSVGTYVRSSLQKHYGRKQINDDEFTLIKSAMITIPDEESKARALNTLRTLKATRKKKLKPLMEGGNDDTKEIIDHAFVQFFHMANRLGIKFPGYFWIIFRFVFFHIPTDVLIEFMTFTNPNTPDMIQITPSTISVSSRAPHSSQLRTQPPHLPQTQTPRIAYSHQVKSLPTKSFQAQSSLGINKKGGNKKKKCMT